MSKVINTKDAVIVTGEYTDAQGNLKKSYMNIGTLFMFEDGGLSLKLDACPIGNGNINFYDRKPKQQQPQQPQQPQPQQQPQPPQQQAYQHPQAQAQTQQQQPPFNPQDETIPF
jgi:hypothetical protein